MEVSSRRTPDVDQFSAFVRRVQPRLLRALVATYGPVDGREATVDALSWAWLNWDRLAGIDNPAGYLYRVGQSAVRQYSARPVPPELMVILDERFPDIEPGLLPALGRLSAQQRTVVMLVHGFDWSQAEVAEMMEINPSTVREHLNRAISKLRDDLEVEDANRRP